MQFPKLTPLQSRFAASFAASLVLIILYLTFSNPQFAYAIDTESTEQRDHKHPFILDNNQHLLDGNLIGWDNVEKSHGYEPSFEGLGQSITGRAPGDPPIDTLENNVPGKKDISPGDQQFWSFPKEELQGHTSSATPDQDGQPTTELRKRQSINGTFYLTLNVCDQPSAIFPNPNNPPPPLVIYVSNSSENQRPNPSTQDANQVKICAEQGYAYYPNSTSDGVYIGIFAPTDSNFQGTYNYELTISTDAAYASYEENNNTFFYIDSDSNAGLFVSTNLTDLNTTDPKREALLAAGPPFGMFVHNQNDTSIRGISKSYCGLRKHAQIKGNIKGLESTDVEVAMTLAGGGFLKQQYYVRNLNRSSEYYAIQAIENSKPGPGNVKGGGSVSKYIAFNTKSDGNCQLIYNLTFCNDTTYAVPSNPNNQNFPNSSTLAKFYDDNAFKLFQNFTNSLEQVPCNTTFSAQYSLAVTCEDCAQAYKRWLCAVTIPRCADFSSFKPYLQPRNIAQKFTNGTSPPTMVGDKPVSDSNRSRTYINSSRNILIDQVVHPGPYNEVLPCKELCYGLVQSCPASLQFACPLQGFGLECNYGSIVDKNNPQCNMPGVFWGVNDSLRLKMSVMTFSVGVMIASGIGFVGI